MYSITHDITALRHDRDFQDMHLPLPHTRSWPENRAIRISDLQPTSDATHVMVYQFGPTINGVGMGGSLNLMVWLGHMRFLYPSPYTKRTAWRDWQSHVHEVVAKVAVMVG